MEVSSPSTQKYPELAAIRTREILFIFTKGR
jgi:hypothetical protein